MKYLPVLFLCAHIVCVAEPVPVVMNEALKSVVFSPAGELHIIGVDKDDDQQLRWITWGERSEQSSTARLAVVSNSAQGPNTLSSVERRDAYAPSIVRAHPWRYGKHPVLAWTYQYGAAAQTLELYGLDDKEQLVKLDEASGALITWSVNSQGKMLANVHEQANARLSANCYDWQEKRHKLVKASCR